MIPTTDHTIDLAHNILCTAVESGINYWCLLRTYKWRGTTTQCRVDPLEGWEQNDDPPTHPRFGKKKPAQFTVTAESLIAALQKLVEDDKMPTHWRRLAASILIAGPKDDIDYDAEGADVLFQYAALGEIRYG